MNWRHLIAAAYLLAGRTLPPTGRPRQAMLQRAVSAAYYAMFQALCFSNANTLVGAFPDTDRAAWTRVYRALEHGVAYRQMRPTNDLIHGPSGIRNFARTFRFLQEQRHQADYDPYARFVRSDTIGIIEQAETAIEAFYDASASERRAFATRTLFRDR